VLRFTTSWPVSWSVRLPIQRVPAAFSLEEKLPWREAAHSPPSSAEVMKTSAEIPLPHTS
jgi:hypothetical protein